MRQTGIAVSVEVEVVAMSQVAESVMERLFQSILGGLETVTIAIGDRLGFYVALDAGPQSPTTLATATNTSRRYCREWLEQQAVYGLLEVARDDADADLREFALAPGVAETLARPDELTTVAPLARMVAAAAAQWTRIAEGAQTGEGLGWAEYGTDMREAQADANAPALRRLLADEWLRSGLPDVYQRMAAGESLKVADVGCGAGWASVALASRFPRLSIDAYDVDPATVELATKTVKNAGLTGQIRVIDHDLASSTPTPDYDLAMAIECVHDMPHPVPVLAAMRAMVKPQGVVLVVDEKVADELTIPGDDLEKLMYGYSTLVCLPDGMSGNPTGATGTVMRRPILERYAREAGFGDVEVLPVEHDIFRFYRLR